jgi:hypothetical protein
VSKRKFLSAAAGIPMDRRLVEEIDGANYYAGNGNRNAAVQIK